MKRRLPLPVNAKRLFERHGHLGATTVFKFTSRAVAEKMLSEGSIKIGSLKEYRDIESKKLRDRNEGMNIAIAGDRTTFREIPDLNPFRRAFNVTGSGNDGVIKGIGIIEEFDFPICCFSYASGEAARDSLVDEDNGYDCCVKVSDIFGLCEKIADHLSTACRIDVRYRCLPVLYQRKVLSATDDGLLNDFSAFLKPPIFSENVECRILFRLATDPHKLTLIGKDDAHNSFILRDKRFAEHFSLIEQA